MDGSQKLNQEARKLPVPNRMRQPQAARMAAVGMSSASGSGEVTSPVARRAIRNIPSISTTNVETMLKDRQAPGRAARQIPSMVAKARS